MDVDGITDQSTLAASFLVHNDNREPSHALYIISDQLSQEIWGRMAKNVAVLF